MLGGNCAVTCHKAVAKGIYAEDVVYLVTGSLHIGRVAGKLGSIRHDYSGVGDSHIAAPVEFIDCNAVGRSIGNALHCGSLLSYHCGGVFIYLRLLVDTVHRYYGDIAVVAYR